MNIKTQSDNVNKNVFMLAFYFFLIILIGALEGQLHITNMVSRILVGGFLFFSTIFFLIWNNKFNHIVIKDASLQVLFIFCLYTGVVGVVQHDALVIMHAIGLFVISYFIYMNTLQLTTEQGNVLLRKLGYIVFCYVVLNAIFLLVAPERMWGGGVLDIHSDHPFIGFLSTPNSNADVLFISTIIATLALLVSKNKKELGVFLISILLLFVLIILSESRSVVFSTSILIGMLGLYFIFFSYRQIAVMLKIFILLIISICAVLAFLKFYSLHPHAHLFNNSLMGRQGIWFDSIHYIILHHQYIFGVGFGRQEKAILASNYNYFQAHNSFVDVFLGTGIIGIILFLVYCFLIFWFLIKQALADFNKQSFIFLVAACVIVLHSLVESYLINQLSPDLYCFALIYGLSKFVYSNSDYKKLITNRD